MAVYIWKVMILLEKIPIFHWTMWERKGNRTQDLLRLVIENHQIREFRHLVFLHLPILSEAQDGKMSTWKQGAFFSKNSKIYPCEKIACCLSRGLLKRKSCLFYGSRKVFLLVSPFWSQKTWNRNDFYQNYTFPSNESAPFLLKQPSLFHPKQGQYSLSPTLQPHHAKNTSNLNATPNSTFQSTSMNSNQLEQRSKPLCHSVILLGSWRDPYINLLQSYVAGIVLYIKNHQPKWTAKLLTSTSSTSQKNSKKKTHQVLPRSTLPASWCFFPTSPHPSTTPQLAKHHLPPWPPLL